MSRATAVSVAMMLLAVAVSAQTPQRALLPVTVNGVDRGEVLALVQGDDVLVPKSFFDSVGVTLPAVRPPSTSAESAVAAERRRLFDAVAGVSAVAPAQPTGDQEISLLNLAPQVTFVLNPADLTLSITVDPHLLGRQVLEMREQTSDIDHGGDPSAFLNYAVNGGRHGTPSFYGEFGAGRGNWLLYTGFSQQSGQFLRGLSNATLDWPSRLRRLSIGDATIGSDPLGGTATIGGVTLGREFSLQPTFLPAAPLDITATALTPSSVEVYVNGQLVNRIEVGPGVFTLHNVPATAGLGTTQIVIRDAFGRESTQQSGYYFSTSTLRRGLSDYVFSAGAIRRDFLQSVSYGRGAVLAQYRRGFTDSITAGARIEAVENLVSGGPRLTMATPIGDIDAEVAASRAHQQSGTAAWFAYRFTTRRYSVGAGGKYQSDNYANISMLPGQDRVTRDTSIFASAPAGPLNLGILGSRSESLSGQLTRRLAFQVSAPIGRYASFMSSIGTAELNKKRNAEVSFGLVVSLGRFSTASLTAQTSQGDSSVVADLRRPLGQGNGFGYSIQTNSSTNARPVSLQYQSSFGRYEIFADASNTQDAAYSAAGGLVYLDGSLLLSRAVKQGYALARVGVPGVEVYAANQPIGRSNRNGDLLIGSLLPYFLNDLSIRDTDVPLDYEVSSTHLSVMPPSRGGVVARFPIRKVRAYTAKMRLVTRGQSTVPGLGELDIQKKNGEVETLSLGRDGEFYVENLDPGVFSAVLRTGDITCKFRLTLPKTDEPVADLGIISCQQ